MKKINTLKIALVSVILFSHNVVATPSKSEAANTVPMENAIEHQKLNKNLLKGTEVINIGGDGKWPDEAQLRDKKSTCLLGFCFDI